MNTNPSVREICQLYVKGGFKEAACPNGSRCWKRHPSPIISLTGHVAITTERYHVKRICDYLENKNPFEAGSKLQRTFNIVVKGTSACVRKGAKTKKTKQFKKIIFLDVSLKSCVNVPQSECCMLLIDHIYRDGILKQTIDRAYIINGAERMVQSAEKKLLEKIASVAKKVQSNREIKVRILGQPCDVCNSVSSKIVASPHNILVDPKTFDHLIYIFYVAEAYYWGFCSIPQSSSYPDKIHVKGGKMSSKGSHNIGSSHTEMSHTAAHWRKATVFQLSSNNSPSCPTGNKLAVSRAYWKMNEVFLRSNALQELQKNKCNQFALDIGASPGGWSYCLSQFFDTVVAVDPGQLAEPIPVNVSHKQMKIQKYLEIIEKNAKFGVIVCDMNASVHQVYGIIESCVSYMKPGGYFIITLKNFRENFKRKVAHPENHTSSYVPKDTKIVSLEKSERDMYKHIMEGLPKSAVAAYTSIIEKYAQLAKKCSMQLFHLMANSSTERTVVFQVDV